MSTPTTTEPTTADLIVCPAWCAVTQDEHRAEIPYKEGMAHHRASFGGDLVDLALLTFPDGTEDRETVGGPRIGVTDAEPDFEPAVIPALIAALTAAYVAVTTA